MVLLYNYIKQYSQPLSIMKCKIFAMVLICVCFSVCGGTHHDCAHTWSIISVEGGEWNVTLRPLFEKSYFFFSNCETFNISQLSSKENTTFGFMYGKNANFNIVYALTLVNTKSKEAMVSRTCIFVITAVSPANPDIKVLSYNGAKCKVESNGPDGALYMAA